MRIMRSVNAAVGGVLESKRKRFTTIFILVATQIHLKPLLQI